MSHQYVNSFIDIQAHYNITFQRRKKISCCIFKWENDDTVKTNQNDEWLVENFSSPNRLSKGFCIIYVVVMVLSLIFYLGHLNSLIQTHTLSKSTIGKVQLISQEEGQIRVKEQRAKQQLNQNYNTQLQKFFFLSLLTLLENKRTLKKRQKVTLGLCNLPILSLRSSVVLIL